MSVRLMKRIADNPHDEHLGAEIAEGGDFLSSKVLPHNVQLEFPFSELS